MQQPQGTPSIWERLHNGLHDTLPADLEVDLDIVDYGGNDAAIEIFDFDINNVKLAHELFILDVTPTHCGRYAGPRLRR